MKFSCDQCSAQYMIADEKVGAKGVKVRCKKCSNIIVVKPTAEEAPGATSEAPAPDAATPATAPKEQEMGGAFNSLFGGQTPFDQPTQTMTQNDLNALRNASETNSPASSPAVDQEAPSIGFDAPVSPAPSAQATKAGEKEWYVAIDDSQVGPVDLAEIEQRWDTREINEDSLAWKSGMPDWLPVADVPELSYLLTERPQKRPTTSLPANTSHAATSTLAAASLGPVALGGGGQAAASDGVSWKPSAASALSSLVQDELVAQQKPEEPAPPVHAPPMDGMPSFGANDLFGGGNGSAAPAPMPNMARGPSSDPFGGGGTAWQVPSSRGKSGGGIKAVHVVLGLLAVVIIALGGVLGIVLFKPSVMENMQKPAPAAVATAPKTGTPEPERTKPVEEKAAEPEAKAEKTAKEETAEEASSKVGHKLKEKTKEKREPKTEVAGKTEGTGGKPPKKDELDNLFEEKGGGGGAPANAKATLDKQDIVEGVKSNAASVAPCIKEARTKNEIVPGSYKFVLDWTIKPSGAVEGARLTGPDNVLGTSLPGCFASVMKKWKFPPSKSGAPIKNFPFPATVR